MHRHIKELGRKWLRLAVLLAVVILGGCFLYSYNQVDKPQLVNTQGRTFEKATVTDILQDNLQEQGVRVGDQIVSLRLDSGAAVGQTIVANCPNGLLFGTVCQPGMRVIVISSMVGQLDVHTVYNVDRMMPIFLFVGVFLLLLCVVGGPKGIRSAVALVFTFTCFIFLFFPMILRGLPPILAAVITSAIVLAGSIYIIHGNTVKALSAVLATFGGIVAAGLAAVLFGQAASLSGYNVANIESLLFVGQNTLIDVGQLLFAGILFASLGAIMDIAMDVCSAASELRYRNPGMTAREVFAGTMNVGRDVMGTMATTLILAFFGGSLGIWVMDYVYDLPWLQLINSNSIGIEIMQGLSGSFGVILTVPIAAALSAWLPVWIHNRKK